LERLAKAKASKKAEAERKGWAFLSGGPAGEKRKDLARGNTKYPLNGLGKKSKTVKKGNAENEEKDRALRGLRNGGPPIKRGWGREKRGQPLGGVFS